MAKTLPPEPEQSREGIGPEASPAITDRNSMEAQLDTYRRIFDNIYNGVMVTDADGYVTHFNRPYGQFLELDPDEQIGKHCLEVVENTRMHIVAQTGIAEINQSHWIKGQNMVVQRIPIKKNGRVIAVFGQVMFKDVRDVTKLANKLSLLESKVAIYEQELINLRSTRYTFDSIIGKSKFLKGLKKEALKASANQSPVLITGESGTGKELFAQAIHHASNRKIYPFVRINCSAIPEDLLESELFGYEPGAFTGANSSGKPGKFEIAANGTVFLDEIGDLPLAMQPKLLRAIEEKEFERLGGTKILRSDFRVIAATNRNLDEMIATKGFRKDLYYRLNVIRLHIPSLHERRDDIIPLTRHFLKQMALEATLPEIQIDQSAEEALRQHDWPGNVRELANVLERAAWAQEGGRIRVEDLPFYLSPHLQSAARRKLTTLRDDRNRSESETIIEALKATNYNKAQAAKLLGIHRTHLYKKMHQYGIPISARP